MAASVVYSTWGGQIVHENRGGVERDYVPDALGNTIALVDENQNITDTWEYWPYGEVKSHTGPSTTPFTFVGTLGYYKDSISNLTYIRARFYRTFIGQWMTVDQIWPRERAYEYSRNQPTTVADPFGDFPFPGYGKYCGPRNGPGTADDDLDRCCLAHDKCLKTWKQWINHIKYKACQCALCACSLRANCHWGIKCNYVRSVISGWACKSCATVCPLPGF